MSAVVVPIFPLPDITLFPHTLLPLHVFEARYRAMITDALARDRRLAVVGLKPGHDAAYAGRPPVFGVAGAGEIVKWERLATGRYNVLVKGDTRLRIDRELPADTLYRLVVAQPLEEQAATRDVRRSIDHVRASCRRLLAALGRPAELLDDALNESNPAGVIVDQVAALLPDSAVRQALLETIDVDARLTRLIAELDDLVRQITGGRE